jgi:RNA polymerase sigma factor (sigma-70 family)
MSAGQLDTVLRHLRKLAGTGTPEESDAWLLDRFLAHHDEAAFAVLVARHGPMVWGVCHRLLADPNDAEDAFQATFLVLVRRARSLGRLGSLAAWLHGVARRVASRVRAGRRRERPLTEEVPAMSAADPLTEAARQELRTLLDEELGRLPEKYRGPVLLCDVEGNTSEEAARQLGYAPGSMSWRLARGRDLLRRGLARRGVALSAGALAAVFGEEASATVPAAVATATVRAAVLVTAGMALPAPLAALVDGTARAMGVAWLKWVAATVAIGLLVIGAGVAAQWPRTADTAPPSEEEPAQKVEQPAPDKESVADKPAPRVDQQGDPLPPGAIARLGTLRFRGAGSIDRLTFSPDGRLIASDGCVWDVASGKQVYHLETHYCLMLLFSPDSTILASRGGRDRKEVRAWDMKTGQELFRGEIAGPWPGPMAFSRDSKTLAVVGNETVEIWEARTGKVLKKYRNPTPEAHAVAFGPGDRLVIAAGRNPPFPLFDVATGQELCRCRGHTAVMANACFVFSPDGKTLATGSDDHTVRLWEVPSGKELHCLVGHEGDIEFAAFSADGKRLVSSSREDTVRVWDTATGKELYKQKGAGRVALSPNGKILWVYNCRAAVELLDSLTGKAVLPLKGHTEAPERLVFTPDGKMVWSASWDGLIIGWDATTGKRLHTLHLLEPRAHFMPDGRTMRFVSDERTVAEVDLLKDRETRTWRVKWPPGPGVFSPDGTRLLLGEAIPAPPPLDDDTQPEGSGVVHIWDLDADTDLGARLDVGEHRRVWALMSDGRVLICEREPSPDSEAPQSRMGLWEPDTNRTLFFQGMQAADPSSCAFAPDMRIVAAMHGNEMLLWDVTTGEQIGRLKGTNFREHLWHAFTFSPDSRTLATGESGEVRLWDVATLKPIVSFKGHTGDVEALAFSPDGRRLVSSGDDTTLLVWDVAPYTNREPAFKEPTAKGMEYLWTHLAGDDAETAHRAAWALVAGRDRAVAFVKERLRPASDTESKRIDRLIADLDSDSFDEREAASKELARLGRVAEPALKRVLKGQPSAEVQRRAADLLAGMKESGLSSEDVQALRALAVLEHIGSGNARRLIEQLAGGNPDDPLTREAKAVQRRLERSQDRSPRGGR